MIRIALVTMAVALAACGTEAEADPSSTEPAQPVALWEPIDEAFAGCQAGACGSHAEGPQPDVIAQPGGQIGQRTYCPVSGAVFEIDPSRPHRDVNGQTLYFCCAGCAEHFDSHRAEVLRARGIEDGRAEVRVAPTERLATNSATGASAATR